MKTTSAQEFFDFIETEIEASDCSYDEAWCLVYDNCKRRDPDFEPPIDKEREDEIRAWADEGREGEDDDYVDEY